MQTSFVRTWIAFAIFALLAAAASAQTTTGTISGHVVDSQGLALPGVAVTASSPNLQGVRTDVTSGNGDYIFSALPSGTYKITFELSGFQSQERTVNVAPTQAVPLDVTLGVGTLNETVNVVAQTADVLTQTAQVATNFKQDLISTLPTTRDINASLLLAPAVHPTGPSGAYSIAGSMSFETLYMVNGVERQREPARPGVRPLHRRRDSGNQHRHLRHLGRIWPLRRRRRQRDHQVGRQHLQRIVPREPEQRQVADADAVRRHTDRQRSGACRAARRQDGADARVHARRPGAEGSSVVLYRRTAADAGERPVAGHHQHALHLHRRDAAVRGQRHLLDQSEQHVPGRLHEDHRQPDQRHVQHRGVDGHSQPRQPAAARGPVHRVLQRDPVEQLLRRGPRVVAALQLHRVRRADHGSDRRHAAARSRAQLDALLVADLLRRLRPGKAGQHRHLRERHLLPLDQERRIAQRDVRLRPVQRRTLREQPSVGQRLSSHRHDVDHPARRHLPRVAARRHDGDSVESHPGRQRGHQLPHPFTVRQRQLARGQSSDGESRPALRPQPRRRQRRPPGGAGQRVQPATRHRVRSDGRSEMVGDGELREIRRRDFQQHRRLVLARRQPADVPVRVSRPGDQSGSERGEPGRTAGRPGNAVRLVQRQRRRDAAAERRADDSGRDAADSGLARLAEQPRIRGRHQPAVRRSCRRARRLRVS